MCAEEQEGHRHWPTTGLFRACSPLGGEGLALGPWPSSVAVSAGSGAPAALPGAVVLSHLYNSWGPGLL